MSILISRLARTARTRWRTMFLLIGGLLTVIGIALPSGAVLLPGILVLLFALLTEIQIPDCRAAAQLPQWRWHG
jgi:hypothetical protein